MRQTTYLKPHERTAQWVHFDANNKVLGRLAAEIAPVLMGKHRPEYTPHVDCGDFVVVTNAAGIALTGNKAEKKVRTRYTGYPGGLRTTKFGEIREKHPERLLREAVRRMLPKNRLGRVMIGKLKIYAGDEHPHQAQQLVAHDA